MEVRAEPVTKLANSTSTSTLVPPKLPQGPVISFDTRGRLITMQECKQVPYEIRHKYFCPIFHCMKSYCIPIKICCAGTYGKTSEHIVLWSWPSTERPMVVKFQVFL